ncbi:tetratricopeptide repeat protein [uncultured Gelidibacter sp.]|uniref:tetratricopeptide repeat protein n=1 Tax=uncultured Gelidibacter sp. TaxID=259318 RepID=UPI00262365F4|nr:tetratricopeptide repeat protein [uncultured Gelidibacter sp.]
MNTQDFTYLLSHPEELNTVHTANVGEIVAQYPYFQAARALHLKGLKTKESNQYNQELRITAAYTTDRSILFDFITSEAFNQNEISRLIKQNTELLKGIDVTDAEDISVHKKVTLDDHLMQQVKDSDGVLDPDLFEAKPGLATSTSDTSIIDVDVKNIEPSPEEQLQIGKPLEFDKNETHSFTQWLKITSFKPIERETEEIPAKTETPAKEPIQEAKTESGLEKKLELIDKFITTNPKIAPVKESKPAINLAQTQLVQNDSFMTETLARIYLEQKNYDKAIQSYKILILKYPEKSGFFADQIKAVKQIQANNTK